MVVDNDKFLDDIKPQNSGVDEVFKRHKKRVNDESFNKNKKNIFRVSILLGLSIILGSYFFSNGSKVKAIVVEGNEFLDTNYIKKLSELTLDSRYYLNFWILTENKIEKSDMIKNAIVTYEPNNVVKIVVDEKRPVGYRYIENPEILLSDGSVVPLKSEYMSFVSRIPLITGFVGEEPEYLLTKALSKVELNMIENIAEISQYNFNYDPFTLQVFMRDGNYFFASYYSLEFINAYNSIASELVENGVCIFADDSLKVAFKKKCPWDDVSIELEYWKNENGEFILNKYGDKVVIHYLKDEFGNFVLDELGNKIPIPIDDSGEEILPNPEEQVEELPNENQAIPE